MQGAETQYRGTVFDVLPHSPSEKTMTFVRMHLLVPGLVLRALCLCPLAAAEPAEAGRPVVRVAYFIPTDRKPEPDYQARLDRVMKEVQRFYRDGMKQNGHGEMTFEYERDE